MAVQATFDIGASGQLALAERQEPPPRMPEFRGDPAETSLRCDSDLLARKPGTDVILDALAHAPLGRPAATVPVTLLIDRLEKTLLVHGTRVYYRGAAGMTTTRPQPFATAPIHYEAAFGGIDRSHADPRRHAMDARNPVGRGFAVDPKRLENQPAHTIEYPSGDYAKMGPAGFGPIASFWSPRRERAGTYDAAWEKRRKPLLPEDYDERHACGAPDDQRPRAPLLGGEMIALTNMTPSGMLRFLLPRIALSFTSRIRGRHEQHTGMLTTVFVAPEAQKVRMIWQTTLRVPAPDVDYIDVTVIAAQSPDSFV